MRQYVSMFGRSSKKMSDHIHVVNHMNFTEGPQGRRPTLACVIGGESECAANPPTMTTGSSGTTTHNIDDSAFHFLPLVGG